MLTAEKKRWFGKIFSIYNRNLIKRRFDGVRIENLDRLKSRNGKVPLILYINHSSWWDGLIAYEICRQCAFDDFVMMEEKQLAKLPLFRKVGAFSVVRENPRAAVESLNYAANVLSSGINRVLYIFPQGEIKPNDARPIVFYNGISRIIEKLENCDVVPVAMKFEFLGEFKPEIFIKIGDSREFRRDEKISPKSLTAGFAAEMENLLDALKNDVISENTANYKKIV